MENVVLVIHLILALAIIGLVLLQRSEGGGLGIGGGGGLGRLATPRGTANLLTRATAICGACFFATSLILALLAGHSSQARHGILSSTTGADPTAVEKPLTPEAEEQPKEVPPEGAAPLEKSPGEAPAKPDTP